MYRKGWGRESRNKESYFLFIIFVVFFWGGGGVFVDGGKLKRVETVNKGIKYTPEI